MPGTQPPQIGLYRPERRERESLARARKTPQAVVRRARVVLLAAMGYSNLDIARTVPMDEEAVGMWRRRWFGLLLSLEIISVVERLERCHACADTGVPAHWGGFRVIL